MKQVIRTLLTAIDEAESDDLRRVCLDALHELLSGLTSLRRDPALQEMREAVRAVYVHLSEAEDLALDGMHEYAETERQRAAYRIAYVRMLAEGLSDDDASSAVS